MQQRLRVGNPVSKSGLALLFSMCLLSPVLADEIYMTTDADGSVSFTDFPVAGAEVIEIELIPADPELALSSQELIDQQLAVADSLEASRLAREQAITDRIAALAASQPQTYYYPVERDIGDGDYWGYGYGSGYPDRGPWRPGYRPPGFRPPGLRPPRPEHPIRPGRPMPPAGDGLQAPAQSRPMMPQR